MARATRGEGAIGLARRPAAASLSGTRAANFGATRQARPASCRAAAGNADSPEMSGRRGPACSSGATAERALLAAPATAAPARPRSPPAVRACPARAKKTGSVMHGRLHRSASRRQKNRPPRPAACAAPLRTWYRRRSGRPGCGRSVLGQHEGVVEAQRAERRGPEERRRPTSDDVHYRARMHSVGVS